MSSRFLTHLKRHQAHRDGFDLGFAAFSEALDHRLQLLQQDLIVLAGIRDPFPYAPQSFQVDQGVIVVDVVPQAGGGHPVLVRVAWWSDWREAGGLPTLIAIAGSNPDPSYATEQRAALVAEDGTFRQETARRFLAALDWLVAPA